MAKNKWGINHHGVLKTTCILVEEDDGNQHSKADMNNKRPHTNFRFKTTSKARSSVLLRGWRTHLPTSKHTGALTRAHQVGHTAIQFPVFG